MTTASIDSETRNVELVRDAYQALATGDFARATRLLAPGVEAHLAPEGPFAGDYRGIEDVLEAFTEIVAETVGTLRVETETSFVNDEYVVGITTSEGERRGERFSYRTLRVTRIVEGRIAELWEHNIWPVPGDISTMEDLVTARVAA